MKGGLIVPGRPSDPSAPTSIITENSVNHGDEAVAAEMIEAAADAIKLQTIDAGESFAPDTPSYRKFKGKEFGLDVLVRPGATMMFSVDARHAISARTNSSAPPWSMDSRD